MKSILLAAWFALVGVGLSAQGVDKAVDKARDLILKSKKMDAKAEIDKVLAVEKNQKSPDVWYYKCKIYASIGEDSSIKQQVPDAFDQALSALKKYTELDEAANKKKEEQSKLLVLDLYKPINTIYAGYFQDGAANYNTGKYQDALADFKGAINTRDFMFTKGWVTQQFDTITTLYAGIAAEKAKNRDEASMYYSKIADRKLADQKYMDIYKWLVSYYTEDKRDEASALKYLKLGREVFPNEKSWNDLELEVYDSEIEAYRKKGNKDSLFAEYDHVISQQPNSHIFVYNYGVELYNYANDTSSGKKPANSDALVAKAKEQLNKSLQLKPDYAQAHLLLGKITYNEAVDLRATTKNVKGQKPEDIKKRSDIRAAATKKFDEAIPYFEKVDQILGGQGKLKQEEKLTLKDAYDYMITIYDSKNQKEKSDTYTKKFNDVDKIH